MIEHLSIPSSTEAPVLLTSEAVSELVTAHRMESEVVKPGTYNTTPAVWIGQGPHRHELMVLEDGTAVYRLLPSSPLAQVQQGEDVEARHGGMSITIDGHMPVLLVTGNKSPEQEARFYEIYRYISSVAVTAATAPSHEMHS